MISHLIIWTEMTNHCSVCTCTIFPSCTIRPTSPTSLPLVGTCETDPCVVFFCLTCIHRTLRIDEIRKIRGKSKKWTRCSSDGRPLGLFLNLVLKCKEKKLLIHFNMQRGNETKDCIYLTSLWGKNFHLWRCGRILPEIVNEFHLLFKKKLLNKFVLLQKSRSSLMIFLFPPAIYHPIKTEHE